MVRTRGFNNKYQLLASSIHYYCSLTFLRVEIKDQTYIMFRPERNNRITKLAEWPPPYLKYK